MRSEQPDEWRCEDWVAVHDRMPSPDKGTIRVEGTCTFPTPNWEASLDRDNPGINPDPDTLYLRLSVAAPTQPQAQVISSQSVKYVEQTEKKYRLVEINHGEIARIGVDHPESKR